MDIIRELENEATQREWPDFGVGDTIKVWVRIKEGDKTRLQPYEGLVIKRKGSGIGETFTVRRLAYGVGVEKVFPLHSPVLEKIEIRRLGRVRRAKLYFLRGKIGKAARIAERKEYGSGEKTKTQGTKETQSAADSVESSEKQAVVQN
ncbi:MAG: 50S ribosomal protein L19 [Candidatus Omnitrophica bacterium]|nr:50S ribosomal protein L19 [Candidatus Omnitrophota bacterium]